MTITLKLTERDKKLLVLLAALVVGVLFFVVGILPLGSRLDSLNTQLDMARLSRQEMDQRLALLPQAQADASQAETQRQTAAAQFCAPMTSQELDRLFTNMVLEHELEARSVNITQLAQGWALSPYLVQAEADSQTAQGAQDVVSAAQVTLSAAGSSQAIQSLVDEIDAQSPAIRLAQVAYDTDSQGLPTVQLVLEVYMCAQ